MRPIHRPPSRDAARWLIMAAVATMSVWTMASPASGEMGTRPSGGAIHSSLLPHFRPRILPPMGPGIVPPLGPGIVPPFGPGIVPPLVPGPGGVDHRRPHRFPFFPFGGGEVFIAPPPDPGAPQAQLATLPKLPPPPPDFQPHVVTLKPSAAMPGDPASVVVMRPGRPDEVVTFGKAAP
jgi:hypothetical protein